MKGITDCKKCPLIGRINNQLKEIYYKSKGTRLNLLDFHKGVDLLTKEIELRFKQMGLEIWQKK